LYSDECVLQNQRVSPEQLPVNKFIGAFDVSSLLSVKVTWNIHSGGYSIVYTVPEVAETFVLKYVKVLPILLQRNLWVNVQIRTSLIAVND
jgi:hypothetical protein